MSGVDIYVDEDGGWRDISFVVGAGVTLGELADALKSAPRGAMIHDAVAFWYCDADDCDGADEPDDDHDYCVVTIKAGMETGRPS